jgi:hypothetical protein
MYIKILSKEKKVIFKDVYNIKYLFSYMKSMGVESLYLYTDSRCNYGFYDSQNFKRLDEKEIYLNSIKSELNVFLYSFNF